MHDDKRRLDEDNLPEIESVVSVCAGLVTVDEDTTQENFERTQNDRLRGS